MAAKAEPRSPTHPLYPYFSGTAFCNFVLGVKKGIQAMLVLDRLLHTRCFV